MASQRKILFYGNSVVLGTLGTMMRDYPQFQVTILVPPLPERKRLEEMKPDVIFFDLESAHPQAVFSLLESHTGLMLVGVSPDTNMVKVWSGRQLRELSTQGLIEVINE